MKKQQTLKWSTLGGDIVQIDYGKPKRVIKPWTQSQFVTDYFLARDRVLWKLFPGSRVEIEEQHPGINFGYEMEYEDYRYSEMCS